MRHADCIIIGAGVIGLSLALELRKHALEVLLLERHEPGREASFAAAGMLAPSGGDLHAALETLARASAQMYPQFVEEIEEASGLKVDLRSQGTLLLCDEPPHATARRLSSADLARLEPCVAASKSAYFLPEQSVDPRALVTALVAAAKHRGIHIASGASVQEIRSAGAGLVIKTSKNEYSAALVVNCAGAWSGEIPPVQFPSRPVKGQIFSVIPPRDFSLAHVVRAPEIYLVPRSDGRILIGATAEEAGFDKRVEPAVINHMHQLAANLVPRIGEARIHESWVGLRPATADDLPVLSATDVRGYFIATGHFRNGILLAPITARVMSKLIRGRDTGFDLGHFLLSRFAPRKIGSKMRQ